MKRSFALLALLALAQPLAARDRQPLPGRGYANPSAVIAAEVAFAQAAQDKGQWTAFRDTAAPDAVMFEPAMVYAQQVLKDRPNPAVAVKWQPHIVWSSCDGSLMVSHSAWQRPGSVGYFTTLWQRQKDGKYKWVLDHGDSLTEALAAPEMLSGLVADCPARGEPRLPAPKPIKLRKGQLPPLDPAHRSGKSSDGTLAWEVTVDPSGARNLSVNWRKEGEMQPMLIESVDAPPPSAPAR